MGANKGYLLTSTATSLQMEFPKGSCRDIHVQCQVILQFDLPLPPFLISDREGFLHPALVSR